MSNFRLYLAHLYDSIPTELVLNEDYDKINRVLSAAHAGLYRHILADHACAKNDVIVEAVGELAAALRHVRDNLEHYCRAIKGVTGSE